VGRHGASRAGAERLIEQTTDNPHRPAEKVGESHRLLFWQVPKFLTQTHQTFSFGGRPHRDPQVLSKLQWSTQGVALNNIGFDRDGSTANLVKQGAGFRMICRTSGAKSDQGKFVSPLPGNQRLVLVHNEQTMSYPYTFGINLLRTGPFFGTFRNHFPLPTPRYVTVTKYSYA